MTVHSQTEKNKSPFFVPWIDVYIFKGRLFWEIEVKMEHMVHVSRFIFFPLRWHRSDLSHEFVSWKKSADEIGYCPMGFGPPSNVEMTQIFANAAVV